MDYSNTAVIIPCYNEALTIGKVVDDFHRELPGAVVYVYDNNSSDDTSQIAKQHGATVRHESRQGKGNVCRQMFRDIDAEWSTATIPTLLRPPSHSVSPSLTAKRI